MKEYHINPNSSIVNPGFIERELYSQIHKNSVISCVDVCIKYNGGILLVRRSNDPARGQFWVIGGRLEKNVSYEETLKTKAKMECGLELRDIQELKELGTCRQFFEDDPFNHGTGTDTSTTVYFARGLGEVRLDNFHDAFKIVKPEDYTKEFKVTLHPYIQDCLDLCLTKLIKSQ